MTTNPKLSPMLQQFFDLKKKHPDALLLFKCGDFYETYNDDAITASEVLGITLTRRASDGTQMAGFPYHALDTYLPKLIRAGKRVAIADQIEEHKPTAKHAITEVISPTPKTEQTNNNTTTNNATMTNEEMENKIAQIKKEAQEKILAIASETIKALGGKLPATLNTYYADAIGKLELIKLKHRLNAEITKAEMQFLIEQASIAYKG